MNAIIYAGLNVDLQRDFLKNEIVNVKVASIITEFSREIGFTNDQILGTLRVQNLAITRSLCILAIKELTGYSYKRIGSIFKRDHTTIIYNVKVGKDMIDTHKKSKAIYDRIIKRFK